MEYRNLWSAALKPSKSAVFLAGTGMITFQSPTVHEKKLLWLGSLRFAKEGIRCNSLRLPERKRGLLYWGFSDS